MSHPPPAARGSSALSHCPPGPPYAWNRLTRRAARGPRSSGSEAANVDRRAQGDKRRPSGQGPGAKLRNGLVSQRQPASRAARAHRRSPAYPAPPDRPSRPQTAPRSGSDPRQTTTRSPAPNSQGSATAAAIRLRRSFHDICLTAIFLVRDGFFVFWLLLGVCDCCSVLARDWHDLC